MSVKLGNYGRSVSIIGVGATPFMQAYESQETEGYTEGELFAMAAKRFAELIGKKVIYYPGHHNAPFELPVEFAVCVLGTLLNF